MESVKFEFGSSSQYVKLIDDTFGIETRSLLQLLAKNCHKQYGFNYELGSKIEQYYSNVHATVLFNLYLSNLLNERELKILQDSCFISEILIHILCIRKPMKINMLGM